ncbi:hypothetical protein [Natrinema sp. 1APR25-10V2]|uniref:hypothetical protein n=1 Tax=Natrinema sp. 1APR25-10V2 TaxID=2951081 RepID=UPI002875D654|nr:hypothetical protein [Natrinema sp. 1APR25-10V2]MDS0477421.1 hypothetical protein [Natrinema sp. 1APR25-10V2]
MRWRCTRCGTPDAERDPPCDDCGHDALERAVVLATDGGEREPDREPIPSGTVDTGPEYVWACSNCGREHVRNTPPCARCGNPDLERVERSYDGLERDLSVPGWLEVAKPYLPILAAVAVLVVLFATGIIPPTVLPGIGPSSPPPPDAPGNGTEAAGIDLEATEELVHEGLEAERNASESRRYDEGLGAYAEYQNRGFVAVEFADAEPDAVPADEFDHDCGDARPVGAPLVLSGPSIDSYENESALAADVAEGLLSSRFGTEVQTGFDAEGLDIHVAPNGDIYVFYATC